MSDPRLTPANAHVMARALPADGSGRIRVTPEPMQVITGFVDLLRAPDGPRDRQLLLGDEVNVLDTRDGLSFVQACKDGYVGYVPAGALGPPQQTTHTVSAPATHVYEQPDFKSPDRFALSFGARLTVTEITETFAQTPFGFVPTPHLRSVDQPHDDPVAVAELFLGTPYLWGGNSRAGLDCSGLVQAACLACNIPCPGDSDLQESTLGHALPPNTHPERGDLMFWKGHVAWVASATHLLHANAHSMSAAYEELPSAIARIEAAGDGPVTAHKRL